MVRIPLILMLACGSTSGPTGGGGGGGGDMSGTGGGGDMQMQPACPDSIDAGNSRWIPLVGCSDCRAAWGTDGSGLSACDTVKDNYVVVRKTTRNIALCSKGELVKNFPVGLGHHPVGDKEKEGDSKTPEGVFYIASRNDMSMYYKDFLFSYPDSADAVRGLDAGLIMPADQVAIDMAQASCTVPPQDTGLGGLIEIHGDGSSSDWTVGCVALDNPNLDILWSTLSVGDSIVVYP